MFSDTDSILKARDEIKHEAPSKQLEREQKVFMHSLQLSTEQMEAIRQIIKEQQQKLTEEPPKKKHKSQEQFVDTICHELRNPLHGIFGSVDLLKSNVREIRKMIQSAPSTELKEELRGSILRQLEDVKVSLAAIDKCARFQKMITDDVLNMSKLEAGKVELNLIDFDAVKLVRDVVSMLETQASQKHVRFNLNLPSSKIRVKGDPNRLTQVLLNLLSNAVKFTLERGQITVSLSVSEETEAHTVLLFTVEDTGIGMTEEEQGKLFQPFMQASQTISTEYGGSGLGLVISKNLIELMNGKIGVKSKKWQGTQFSFTIKCTPATTFEEDQKSIRVDQRRRNQTAVRQLHILIVEDNLINQKILVQQLEGAGHICSVANNGQKAIEIQGKKPADLILMDIEMPIMNGLEATQAIRQKESVSLCLPVPIIGISGHAGLEYQERALSSGINVYLTKPYFKRELLEAIARCIPSISVVAVTPVLASTSPNTVIMQTEVLEEEAKPTDTKEFQEFKNKLNKLMNHEDGNFAFQLRRVRFNCLQIQFTKANYILMEREKIIKELIELAKFFKQAVQSVGIERTEYESEVNWEAWSFTITAMPSVLNKLSELLSKAGANYFQSISQAQAVLFSQSCNMPSPTGNAEQKEDRPIVTCLLQ